MTDTTERKAGSLDIGAYRINQSYGDTLGSKKLVSHVAVGKPVKGRFFQSSADTENKVDVYIYEDKLESTFHLVSPAVSGILGGLVRAVTLHLAIDRANNPFLILVPFTCGLSCWGGSGTGCPVMPLLLCS